MRIPAPNQNTPSNRSTENTPNSPQPVNSDNAVENQNTVKERIESIISEIESFQNNFAKITTHINALAHGKESHEAALKNLELELQTRSTRIDTDAWVQKCINHKKEAMHIQTVINIFLQEKHFIGKPLQNAKIELAEFLDEPKSAKMDAIHEREIEYLLSIAKQKIAAADFSIAADNANQAQRDLSNIKYLPNFPSNNPDKSSSGHQGAEHNSNPSLLHFITNMFEEKNKQSKLHLNEEETTLHQLEKILQDSNLAVEKAKMALDQCILNAALPDSTDDAFLTTPASPTMPADTQAIDEAQDYEPVIATGMDEHPELI